MNTRYIWENGSVLDWKKGTTHVMNPSMQYGVAAFEGIRFYNTKKGPAIFRLNDHFDRLFYSMGVLGMSAEYNYWQLTGAIIELIRRNEMTEGYIRPIAWFSDEEIGLHSSGKETSIQIALFDWLASKDALRVHISPFRRIHPATTDVEAKISGNYVNSKLAIKCAEQKGFDDAILLDHEGYVAEGTGANIFYTKDGMLYTPPRGAILMGITRDTVMSLVRKVSLLKIDQAQLLESDEIFLCGTAYEIIPVVRIEDTVISNGAIGPLTRTIQKQYSRAVRGELLEHQDWLTYVNLP